MNKKLLMIFALLSTIVQGTWAQGQFGDIPETVDAKDVEVAEVSHIQFMSHDSLVVNPVTGQVDTLHINDGHRFLSEDEYQSLVATHPARAPRRIKSVYADTDEYGDWDYQGDQMIASYANLYNYKYPSVDANGNKVVLSAIMAVPTLMTFWGCLGTAKPNNLLIACHETITSNWECPTNYKKQGSFQSGNGMMLEFARYDGFRQPCCLVIMPDYEGYGCTAGRPHPYLYQELTARQVVDAVRYGIALHKEKEKASFEDDWKSVCLGYSQGGSVALATHKFIETNGLVDELHFAGSVCGDGPYDPIAHLRYYMEDNGRTYDVGGSGEAKTEHTPGTVSMPIVMPLILKGMCDSNPIMRQHTISEYLSNRLLSTGSTMMIEAKKNENKSDQYSTSDVNEKFREYRENGANWKGKVNNPYGDPITVGGNFSAAEMEAMLFKDDGDNVWGKLRLMMTENCWNYFSNKDNFEDAQGNRITPTERGFMQDLHRALESNNLTVGWVPKKRVAFYHSTYDTVVPYANLLSFMKNQNTLKYYFNDGSTRCMQGGVNPPRTDSKKDANVFIYDSHSSNDHVKAGQDFFFKFAGTSPDYLLFKWVIGDN